MWIIPKVYPFSASVPDTLGLNLDSKAFCEAAEMSLMWRSKLSPFATWLRRWKREPWIQHLSTRTLKPSHSISFATRWVSSLEDFPANRSLIAASEKAVKTPDICSHISRTGSSNASQNTSSSKTLKESSLPSSRETTGQTQRGHRFCSMSSENWKELVTSRRGEYSQRAKCGHPTDEKGFLSSRGDQVPPIFPTVTARDWKDTMGMSTTRSDKEGFGRLDRLTPIIFHYGLHLQARNTSGNLQEFRLVFATPTVCGNHNSPGASPNAGIGLSTQVKELMKMLEGELPENLKLNPRWVETLMGVPIGWTMPTCANPVIIVPTKSDYSETE